MSVSSRRDPLLTDTVFLNQETKQYQAVTANGDIADINDDVHGITMASGSEGDPVTVCQLGFCPAIVTNAADNNEAGTELQAGADGELVALRDSGGGTAFLVGRSQEATGSDGQQTGFWIDCVSLGREQEIPA